MCIIVDASVAAGTFLNPPHPNAEPVIRWIEQQDGKLVFGGRLTQELYVIEKARRYLREASRRGDAIQIPNALVDEEEAEIEKSGICRSDDAHVIALARVSGARVLYSNDRTLGQDFNDHRLISNPRGKHYKRPEHEGLLRHTNACRRLLGS